MQEHLAATQVEIDKQGDMNSLFSKIQVDDPIFEQTILGVLQMKPTLIEIHNEFDYLYDTV